MHAHAFVAGCTAAAHKPHPHCQKGTCDFLAARFSPNSCVTHLPRCPTLSSYAKPARCPVLRHGMLLSGRGGQYGGGKLLRACYAMSGTDIA
eukprot:1556210-Rhodomonas_salina.1